MLLINACDRKTSRTLTLAEYVLKRIGGSFQRIDLFKEQLLPLDSALCDKRSCLMAEGKLSDPYFRYAKAFREAETIVIAAPLWDFSFPAVLKVFMEHVTVADLTFKYNEKGIPEGLCKAKRLIYVTTAGGRIGNLHLGYQYIETLSKVLFSIPDVLCISAEGLDIDGSDVEAILKDTVRRIDQII